MFTEEIDGKVKTIRLLKAENVFIDDIWIGRGVTDRLKEMHTEVNGKEVYDSVNGVSVGSMAQDSTKYYNQKAENY